MSKAFSILKVVIFFTVVALLAVATFAVLKPQDRVYSLQDETRTHEIQLITEAIQIYADEHEGEFPTALNNSAPLSYAELQSQGLPASQLEELAPDFLSYVPLDPHGNEYLVGILTNGNPVAGIELSTGEFVTFPSE